MDLRQGQDLMSELEESREGATRETSRAEAAEEELEMMRRRMERGEEELEAAQKRWPSRTSRIRERD